MKMLLKTAAILSVLVLGFGSALADGVILDSPLMPPESDPNDCNSLVSVYAAPGEHFMFFSPFGTLIITDPIIKCFQNVERVPEGYQEYQFFDAMFEGDVEFVGSPNKTQYPFSIPGDIETMTMETPAARLEYTAELLAMNFQTTVEGYTVMLRESPQMMSSGPLSIADIGGGQFEIDSFFDVFVEVSIDYGFTWVPAGDSVRMTLMYANDPVPMDEDASWSNVKALYR